MSTEQIQQQTSINVQEKANLIWAIADKLVGIYKPHEYGNVILPMCVIKRFEDTLLPTKEAVLKRNAELDAAHIEVKTGFLCKTAGNTNSHTSTGYTATGGAGGTLVTDPNGRTTAVGVGGGSNNSRSSNGAGTYNRCNGRKYESTPYSYAAASGSGWAQPYHRSGGTGCPYCSATTNHYHYPCPECRGFGHK